MLILIVLCAVIITIIAVIVFVFWGLSSTSNDLTKWAGKIQKERAKKDARAIIRLGYIVNRKWYEKTSGILADHADDLEAKYLWEKLINLETQGESTK